MRRSLSHLAQSRAAPKHHLALKGRRHQSEVWKWQLSFFWEGWGILLRYQRQRSQIKSVIRYTREWKSALTLTILYCILYKSPVHGACVFFLWLEWLWDTCRPPPRLRGSQTKAAGKANLGPGGSCSHHNAPTQDNTEEKCNQGPRLCTGSLFFPLHLCLVMSFIRRHPEYC